MGRIAVKRVYEPAARGDGARFLVDRMWPRGVKKEALQAVWLKDAAPSTALRKWFGHDPARWDGFCKRYFAELDANPEAWRPIGDALAFCPPLIASRSELDTMFGVVAEAIREVA